MTINPIPLVIVAIDTESDGVLEKNGIDVVYTGVGKVNAAYQLTKTLIKRSNRRPSIIVNFGTAGSRKMAKGKLVACTTFVQRDMDVRQLGFKIGETPFENYPASIVHPDGNWGLETGICGTGDNFETSIPLIACDVVDMEAYALAKIAYIEKIPFVSIKYISDGSDQTASEDWTQNVKNGADQFVDWYRWYFKT